MSFLNNFKALTGFTPLAWQIRLFQEYFARGVIPAAVDIPTGLGKTAVMALWLIARAENPSLPRRLVYVVDRRVVVDQATDTAINLQMNLDLNLGVSAALKTALGLDGRSLPISTLRGQHIDNREWLEDPSAPAIIIGTVDMIGSRLLFEGYGVSRKMRPYHAGLLGADTLVVLDEAHLVPPFEKLLEAIENRPEQFAARSEANKQLIPPFRLLSLSATGRERAGRVFRLEVSDLEEPYFEIPLTKPRLNAKKSLTLLPPVAEKDLASKLAEEAWKLSEKGKKPIRCIVYCNRRETAELIKEAIEKLAHGGKKSEHAPIAELFVGARRVFEREEAAETLREMGFIAGSTVKRGTPVFLVATSAGEVGVDLDADHMVCDLVAWERMVQRLGRVNRRGEGNAQVVVVDTGAIPKKPDKPTPDEQKAIKQRQALHALFSALPKHDDGSIDASPGALRELKSRTEGVIEPRVPFDSASALVLHDAHINTFVKTQLTDATSPAPLRPALTRALVDAWSMTSLKEHTGRPEIDPWLRGWVDDKPQTTVVWRKYLPLRNRGVQATDKEIEGFFEAAPPHVSEGLETETWRVTDWLVSCAEKLTATSREHRAAVAEPVSENTNPEEADESHPEHAATLHRNDIVAFALSPAGDLRKKFLLKDFMATDKKEAKSIKDNLQRSLFGATLVVDTRLGGLNPAGMLEAGGGDEMRTADDGAPWLVQKGGTPAIRFRVRRVATGEQWESDKNWRERLRFSVEQTDEDETSRWLVIEKWREDAANEEDRAVGPPQTLVEHQEWAKRKARELAVRIRLPEPYVVMLTIAARLHDEGKRAERWQRAFNAPHKDAPYAKTMGPLNQNLLDGYRHEFGSLHYAEADRMLKSLPQELQDLALHLIAAHHGQARPVIRTSGCEYAPPSALEMRACEVALRFARLQKRWGPWGLAWWEALLRVADQQASRDNENRKPNAQKETN